MGWMFCAGWRGAARLRESGRESPGRQCVREGRQLHGGVVGLCGGRGRRRGAAAARQNWQRMRAAERSRAHARLRHRRPYPPGRAGAGGSTPHTSRLSRRGVAPAAGKDSSSHVPEVGRARAKSEGGRWKGYGPAQPPEPGRIAPRRPQTHPTTPPPPPPACELVVLRRQRRVSVGAAARLLAGGSGMGQQGAFRAADPLAKDVGGEAAAGGRRAASGGRAGRRARHDCAWA